MRHFKKRVLALLLAGAVGIGNYASVSASAIKDAQDKKDEAQQELNQVNQQIQNIQSAQNSLQAEMNNYDNQLMSPSGVSALSSCRNPLPRESAPVLRWL